MIIMTVIAHHTGGPVSWSSWSSWSSCPVTCDGGLQERTRSCSGSGGCSGQSRQTRSCNTNSCPASNTWGQWESWSLCSLTCGWGLRTRTRSCEGTGCFGPGSQTQYCNTVACPTTTSSGGWGPWSSWSACASTCGGGLRFRSRRCLSYTFNGCRTGKSYELKSCGSWQCSPTFDSAHHTGGDTPLPKTGMNAI